MTNTQHKAVFLDRDGTVIVEKNYLKDPSGVELEIDAIPALQQLQDRGYLLILVTNQAGIARGYYTEHDFQRVQQELISQLNAHQIHIHQTYFCPHHPTKGKGEFKQDCDCRKPKPGMLMQAIREHQIDPTQSYMIGDKASDVEAGQALGIPSILVNTGYGNDQQCTPDYHASTLLDAVENMIL